MDYRLNPETTIGFALAGGATHWSLAQGFGTGKSDAFQAGFYGVTGSGPLYIGTSLAFSQHWMSTNRTALGSRLIADFDARSYGGRLEAGWRIDAALAALTPYAALQVQRFYTPSYGERDPGGAGFGLNYVARGATHTRAELGARFEHQYVLGQGAALALRGRLAWAHDWISDPSASAVFQALPGASFTVNGATPASDVALASVGTELRFTNGVTLGARFDGEFAGRTQTYAGTGVLRIAF